MTGLMCAAEENHTDAVQVLLKYKADVNLQDRDGQSAMIYATKKNATIRPRHNYAAMVDYINKVSHLPSVMDLLLEAQADLELVDKHGNRADEPVGAAGFAGVYEEPTSDEPTIS
eukprot:g1227.t1